jgi:hypothetical protein
VLPEVGYRQWTLSLPFGSRWQVVQRPELLRAVQRRLVRGVWRWQRQVARRLGAPRGLVGGAVGFTQYFGGALQLTPHLHVLLPEGMWTGAGEFVPLPAPAREEVEGVLRRLVRQLARDFGGVVEAWPEDGLSAIQAEGVQRRLLLVGEEVEPRASGGAKRLAVAEGFSLHADSWVHANDREGLERLCRYGSRSAVALERLFVREDGRYEYRTRKGPVLVLTAAQLVKRLLALIPPRGTHLTCFHGVFAPNAKLRPVVMKAPAVPVAEPKADEEGTPAAGADEGAMPRRPRLDWAALQRRTFGVDVWTCACGGKRSVLAVITCRRTAEEVLRNLKVAVPPLRPLAARSRSPPQLPLAL